MWLVKTNWHCRLGKKWLGYVLSKAAKDWLKMFVNLATFMQNSFRAIIVMLGLVKKTLPNSGHVLAWQHVHWCALLWLRELARTFIVWKKWRT